MSTVLDILPQASPIEARQADPALGGHAYDMARRFMVDALKDHAPMSWPQAAAAVTAGTAVYHEAVAMVNSEQADQQPAEPQTAAAATPAVEAQKPAESSEPLPRRRLPLLKGETTYNLFRDDVELWRAEDSHHTQVWLRGRSVELRAHGVLQAGEELAAISHDMTYGLTNTGRPLSL